VKLGLSVIWLIFAALFLVLGVWHLSESKSATPPFELTERAYAELGTVNMLGSDVDEKIEDFVDDFNEYLSDQNKASKKVNQLAAFGFFVAALTALFSMFLAVRDSAQSSAPQASEEH